MNPNSIVRVSLVAMAAVLLGCTPGEGPKGMVSGTVTLDGQPVDAGQVSFISSDGFSALGNIGPGGSFTLEATLPPGKYTVCVSPPAITEAPSEDDVAVATSAIPSGYFDEGSSDIVQEVQEGQNTLTIELKGTGPAGGGQMEAAP